MSRYKIVLLWISLVFLFFNFGALDAEDRVGEKVGKVSQEALPGWLQDIPIEDLHHFGFSNQEEITQAVVGTPFKIYTIHPYDLINFYFIKGMADILKETGMWYVPIMVNGEYRLLMTVVRMKDKWEVVEICGADLASEIGAFIGNKSHLMNLAGISNDYSLKFVRVFQAASDFMYIETSSGDHLKLFKSAQMAMEIPAEILINPQIIVPKLMAIFERNLR